MTVDEMPAGRPMDALVAEKVMGFAGIGYYGPTKAHGSHLDQVKCDTWLEAKALYDKYWPSDVVADHVREELCRWEDGWGTLYVEPYSTDIAAAEPVIDKMREGRTLTIRECAEGWEVSCAEQPTWGQGETIALAACRFALKAVGVTEAP